MGEFIIGELVFSIKIILDFDGNFCEGIIFKFVLVDVDVEVFDVLFVFFVEIV